ncbi:MAG: S41 family peptidase, partial [Bacteroidota bacterium]
MKTYITLFIASCISFASYATTNPKRTKLLNQVFELLESRIANPYWLEETAYIEFKETLYSEEALALSDEDFMRLFNKGRAKLPFSHFQILTSKKKQSKGKKKSTSKKEPLVSWKEINSTTAYLRVKSFGIRAQQMQSVLDQIGKDTYDNLIIDLRNNTGGNLEGPVALGKFLTNMDIDAGVYLTRKWYQNHTATATQEQIQDLPYLKDFTYQGIGKMFQEEAAFRMVIPGHSHPTFKGKVYVLINKNTASANEPLIDLFKKNDIVTLVGATSAGEMLSGQRFKVNKHYDVFLPISDYVTADGSRIDRVGVSPDIEV